MQLTSPDSCRMGGIEGVGMVGLEYVGRMLRRMGCDCYCLCGDLLEVENLYGSRMGYHGNILLKTYGSKRGRDRKPNLVGGGGQEAETERLILWLVVLELLAGVW